MHGSLGALALEIMIFWNWQNAGMLHDRVRISGNRYLIRYGVGLKIGKRPALSQ
jgi:hypothetical protein